MRMFALSLVILIQTALMAPDSSTVEGHITTCPNCSGPESNPCQCPEAKEVARRTCAATANPTRYPRKWLDGRGIVF